MTKLNIVIPVYNEGPNIHRVLDAILDAVQTPFQVSICYDSDTDSTLGALENYSRRSSVEIELVKNKGEGAHGAVMTGMEQNSAALVLTWPADDTFNAPIIDRLVQLAGEGCEIVVASRFIEGGCMQGAPWLKSFLVRVGSWTLYHLARLPVHDASNGLRLFSRKVIDTIPIESTYGFCYSIEYLVKCHRLGWKIGEVPAAWYERSTGQSRFRVLRWLPGYLRWYCYAFQTTVLRAKSIRTRTVEPKISKNQ